MASRLSQPAKQQSVSLKASPRSLIPIGMATLLPDAAQRMRHLEGLLFDCLATWGYREIIPPTFEYLDVLSAGLPQEVLEKCYKFADWTSGRILVLRPDVTAQIARIVAMGMAGQGLPLRLCYRTTVFRYEPEHAGREREVFQVGVELVGIDAVAMDAEILTLLVESLKVLGVSDFKVSLGHVGFYKGLLARSGMSEEGRKQAEMAAAHKDIPRLEKILATERVSRKDARAILEAPGRYGREEVLTWGRRIAMRDRRLTQPIDRLTRVYHLLEEAGVKEHLLLDLGELRGFDYYDGLVFDVFSGSLGCELGGGGRYNHLIGRFGRDLPSTGFALDVDRLFSVLDRMGEGRGRLVAPLFIAAPDRYYGQTFKTAQTLRSLGFRVLQESLATPTAQATEEVRKRAAQLGAAALVLLGLPQVGKGKAVVVRYHPGQAKKSEQRVPLSDLGSYLKEKVYGHI